MRESRVVEDAVVPVRRVIGPPGSGPRPLPRHEGVNVFRASFAQERLWFLDHVGGGAAYNVVGAFRAEGRLDHGALRKALATVIARHEALRTTFVAMDGRPMQVVSPLGAVGMAVRDLQGSSEVVWRETTEREIESPFDVSRGPLVRLRVLAIAPEEHVVVLALHHLVADAWSVGILVRELCAFYRAAVAGEPVTAPRQLLQYADYSEWQRQRANEAGTDELLEFWRRGLSDAPYPAVASGDRLRSVGGCEVRDLDASLMGAVREAARRASVSPFAAALAAWALALRPWAGSDDVTVLSPVANRERSEVADVVGFFVNLIALRLRLDGDPTVGEILRRVGGVVRDALRHHALPFELVLNALQVDRTLARPPLSPFAFAFERAVEQAIDLPDVTLTALPRETRTARTDLALTVSEHGEGATARLEYDRSIYEPRDVARLLSDFCGFLGVIAADPARRPSSLSTTSGNDVESVAAPGSTMWHRMVAQSRLTPQAIAVRAGGDATTYARLHADARRVAGALVALDAGTDVVVAVQMERGIHWVAAMIGIWGAGAVYLPLDPRWPAARMRAVLEHSGARIVMVDDAAPAELVRWAAESPSRRLVRLDALAATRVDPLGPAAEDVAYLLYTSGSTGRPKGVLIEHRGFANHVAAKVELLALGAGDRVAQTAPASFDVSLWQVAAALAVGGEVVVLDDATTTDPIALDSAFARHRVTVAELVPSMLRLVLDARSTNGSAGLGGLRWLVVTGEALPPELCGRWLERHPATPIVNAYGPTECSDDVTHQVVRTPPSPDALRIPIGRPIPGLTVEVVDERLAALPTGAVGELCVSGVGVGRGYLADPERTAASFVTIDRRDGSPARRIYRTGDRGRRLSDGTFEWLGRLDDQVKIRGVRIEPEEIESALATHPDVRRAAVIAEPADDPVRLIAHVESDVASDDLGDQLRAWLGARLPEAFVPTRCVVWSRLPLTASGKLDRRALAMAPVPSPRTPTSDDHVPATATERLLASLWREVLGVAAGSVTDGFFALGGDSLATIRLVALARRHGLVFTPQQVFEHPTIAGLAAVASTTLAPPVEQGVVVGSFEPTPIQRMLLAADVSRLDHYNMAVLLAVRRSLVSTSLAIAVEHLVRHHDLLRMRVRRDGSTWRAAVAGLEGPVPYAHVDLATLDDGAAGAAIEAAAADAQASLDLARGPILRVISFDLGPARSGRLLVVIHHLACDVASWPILLEDLAAVYEQVEHGEAIVLAPKTASYRAWAEQLAAYRRTEACRGQEAFWREATSVPGARLPRIEGAAATVPRVSDLRTAVTELDPDATSALLAAAARLGATIESAILAALATVLTRGGSEDHVLVYLERHGREPIAGVDVSRTVGWFTAVFPVCVRVAASGRPHDTLVEVDRHLRAVPMGGVGWGLLVDPASHSDESERPEVSCNYLGRVDPPAGLPWSVAPESAGPEVGGDGARPTSLDVVGSLADGRLNIAWHYAGALYDAAMIAALAEGCRDVLRAIAEEDAGSERRAS